MTKRLLRLAFALEFLLALVAIFTAWSEVGGQAVLDAMTWFWKLGLSLALAGATVGFTSALCADQRFWTMRSARWLTAIFLIMISMGAVTYYFQLQTDESESDENSPVSRSSTAFDERCILNERS